MSQKPSVKINQSNLDIFSTAVKLEPIDFKYTKTTNHRDFMCVAGLTKKNGKKITDYMKQAKEMLIQKQTQSPYFNINKDNTKTADKRSIEEKDKNIQKSKKNIAIEIIDKKVSKKQEELNKFEKRINEPDYISSKNNVKNSNILGHPYNLIQLGGGPTQLDNSNLKEYIDLETGLPMKGLRGLAIKNECAIFIYKIDSSYSLDLIPVAGLKPGTGAIYRNYKLTCLGKKYIEDRTILKSAPFNTLYYENSKTSYNEFMIKLGTNGLLINTSSNHNDYNRTIVQNMLRKNTGGIIKIGDILFFKKNNDKIDALLTNEDLNLAGVQRQPAPQTPSKFIQLRDNSRTETILDLRREMFPICYTERHFKYMNTIARQNTNIGQILKLSYLYDKHEKIITNFNLLKNEDNPLKRILKTQPRQETIYCNYLELLCSRSQDISNRLELIKQSAQSLIGTLNQQLLGMMNEVCSVNDFNTPHYLELDAVNTNTKENIVSRNVRSPKRYCKNIDQLNNPASIKSKADKAEMTPDEFKSSPYGLYNGHKPFSQFIRDPVVQHCMKDNIPWTKEDFPNSYTNNCRDNIVEQYVWAMKEMSMICSRCPKTVEDATDLDFMVDPVIVAALNQPGLDETYNIAQFFIDKRGAFVYTSPYIRDVPRPTSQLSKYRTLYRGADYNCFPDGNGSVITNFSYTSTTINLLKACTSAFLKDGGFVYIFKLASDIPYIPYSELNGKTARGCYSNEEEILLPPGCIMTMSNQIILPRFMEKNRITIRSVYVEYINRADHIHECNNYINERSPFSSCHREPGVENLFNNEIRIPNELLNNELGEEQNTLRTNFKFLNMRSNFVQGRPSNVLNSEPRLDKVEDLSNLTESLQNFWKDAGCKLRVRCGV